MFCSAISISVLFLERLASNVAASREERDPAQYHWSTIFADDVACSHGSTVGQLDADQLFYLRARGIDALTAKHMLTSAFVAEIIDAIGTEGIRLFAREQAAARLAQVQS